jgi:hypothetical protein
VPSRLPPSDCPRAVEVYSRLYSPSALATSIKLRWAWPGAVSAADGRLRLLLPCPATLAPLSFVIVWRATTAPLPHPLTSVSPLPVPVSASTTSRGCTLRRALRAAP